MGPRPRPCATVVIELDGRVVELGSITIEPGSALRVFDDLLRLQVALRRRGARLHLQGVAPDVADLLVLVGFDTLLA